MPLFRYSALSSSGERLHGRMDADRGEDVIARLQEAGHLPISARPADRGGAVDALARLWRRSDMDESGVLQFTRQLATLLGAGQPLDRALGILLELPESPQARNLVARVREAVRGGGSLSAALEQQHGVFPRFHVAMTRAGEAGGSLHETLAQLADYLERSRSLRGRVVNALVYPAILMLMIFAAIAFLFAHVVPSFERMFEGLGAGELSMLTMAVLAIGRFVQAWWWVLAAAAALLVLAGVHWMRKPAVRVAFDGWLLRLAGIGALVARLEAARFTRTLGTLVRNGVPLLSALAIARNVVGNRVLDAAVAAAADEVRTGGSLARALSRHERFPRLALQMIQVGEESGELDAMLLRTADTFDAETGRAIDRLLAAMVPVLTIAMTAIVAIVVLAILMPLHNLTSTIG